MNDKQVRVSGDHLVDALWPEAPLGTVIKKVYVTDEPDHGVVVTFEFKELDNDTDTDDLHHPSK